MPVTVNSPGFWDTDREPINSGNARAVPTTSEYTMLPPIPNELEKSGGIGNYHYDLMQSIMNAVGDGYAPVNTPTNQRVASPELKQALKDWHMRQMP